VHKRFSLQHFPNMATRASLNATSATTAKFNTVRFLATQLDESREKGWLRISSGTTLTGILACLQSLRQKRATQPNLGTTPFGKLAFHLGGRDCHTVDGHADPGSAGLDPKNSSRQEKKGVLRSLPLPWTEPWGTVMPALGFTRRPRHSAPRSIAMAEPRADYLVVTNKDHC